MPLVFTRGRRRLAFLLGCFLVLAGLVIATPPPLREQISLNGEWPVGGTVPVYAGLPKFDQRTYERDVAVPAAWAGRIVQLEFGAVNFIARVFIDGTPVGENIGGWCPFALEVTRLAVPGRTFRLRVEVKGPRHPPITDAAGNFAWPVGGWKDRGGIADDVWLRAYGPVHITDAFIQTSVERHTLAVAYTLRNATAETRTVALAADTGAIKISGPPLTLAPGEVQTVTLSAPAGDLALYWPDRPSLHLLLSRVVDVASGAELDRETRRFGFREITIKGNQFYWNGVRTNLYGDYQVFGDTWYVDSAKLHSPQAWPATVDRMKAMNLRVLRWHHNPVPAYLLNVADEKGLLICSEAANYGRDFHQKSDRALYVTNALKTIAPWIRAERNHPSVYLWSATNEMTHSFTGPFAPTSLVPLGEEIARLDPTRPVGYDGDTGRSNPVANPGPKDLQRNRITGTALVDYHYPEAYNKEPKGSIYGWANLVFPDKPTGSGEMLHTRSPLPEMQTVMERNTWWLGVWLRGLRATDWTNVKPACWWFTDADLVSDDPARRLRTLNLRNALAPVALFDKAYDDFGIAPYVIGVTPGGTLPALTAGAVERRTLIVYNDEFRDGAVTIEVALQSGGQALAVGRTSLTVELGSHREISCVFRVPAIAAGGEFAMVLRTFKQGSLQFEEARRFQVQVSPGDQVAATAGPPVGEVVFP